MKNQQKRMTKMYLSDHLPYAVGTRVFFPHGSGICRGVVARIFITISKEAVFKEWQVSSMTAEGETFTESLAQNQLAIDFEHALEMAAKTWDLPAYKLLKC